MVLGSKNVPHVCTCSVRAKLQEESPERAEKFAADVPKAVKNLIKSFKDLQVSSV